MSNKLFLQINYFQVNDEIKSGMTRISYLLLKIQSSQTSTLFFAQNCKLPVLNNHDEHVKLSLRHIFIKVSVYPK